MKNFIISIVAVSLFALAIAVPWALGIAGLDVVQDEEGGEIRELAGFPSEYSNDYFAKVDSFIKDHAPLRNWNIQVMKDMDNGMSKFYEEKIKNPIYRAIVLANATPEPTATPEVTLAPDQTPTPTPESRRKY